MFNKQYVSLFGVIALTILMPGILKLVNNVSNLWVGAEGRLAAISIDTSRPLGPMPRVWEGLAQGGENLTGFITESSTPVAKLKTKYIRIDHIYDQFDLVSRDGQSLKYDFSKLDSLVNQMTELGITPFFSLSYMPLAISSGDILDEPTNWNEWSEVVKKTIQHYSGELGIENVYYEIWNEPDLFGKWKMGGKRDYKVLYYYAAKGAAEVTQAKKFKLGGPATTGLYKNWVDNFFPYILENRLRLDFFSWHRYDTSTEIYTRDIAAVEKWIENQPYFSNVEKIITELGPKSDIGGENDTVTGAAHLIHVMRELLTRVKYGFTFAVTGQWGVVGKPRFDALEYLSKLGSVRLPLSGEGSFVKAIAGKKDNIIQLVIANYDSKDKHSENVPITLLGLSNKSFIVRKYEIGKELMESKVATTESILQINLPFISNSVVYYEFEPFN